ncbi:MAG: glycoside hydrolase [Caldilineaceae bacterium]|nr:glycoside hydrolase [Caldilineaceae bacterium]
MNQHITLYREPGRFAGWPANYGIWAWGDEIVVGFTLGYMELGDGFHPRDKSRPFLPMQARSLDGGETWQVMAMPCETPGGKGLSADEHMQPELHVRQHLADEKSLPVCPGHIDFTHPDFALLCARSGLRAGSLSWFYLSDDRCRSWQGPYRLPLFGMPGVSARTDYLVNGPQDCMLFLTGAKMDGEEGRVFAARTTDGGRSFHLLSPIGPEPAGFEIMPASLRLSPTRLLVAVRVKATDAAFSADRHSIALYGSDDNGRSWTLRNQPVAESGRGGNPPTLTRLQDGRLCLVYGYRAAPYGLRAILSEDEGVSWGAKIVLREDGGNPDIGYPRTVQRPDGSLVTVYYYNDQPEGERYIAATIWRA